VKLSKTSWIFLIIGVLVIAAASLGMAHSQQTEQQKRLESDLAAATQKLNGLKFDDLISQKAALSKQVNDLRTQFQYGVSNLVSSDDSISASNTLLEAARETSVNVTEIHSPGTSPGKLGDINCVTLSVNIKVQGTLSSISSFVSALSQKFPTNTVTMLRVSSLAGNSIPEATSDSLPESTPAVTSAPLTAGVTHGADVNLVIYNYKGG
jgi:hypothetical protein